MDRKRWADEGSKVERGRNITVTTEFLNSDYNEPTSSLTETTLDNGWLVVSKIEPRQPDKLPSFFARWDHRGQCVDIDLEGDPQERLKFEDEKPGYRGHKTKRVTGGRRKYAIDIETPSTGPVFRGTIAVDMDFAMRADPGNYVTLGSKASVEVVRPLRRK